MKKQPIVMPERTWIQSKVVYQDLRICDGLNQSRNPLDIGAGQATSLLNFKPLEYPTLSVREGFTLVGSAKTGHYITHIRSYADTLVIGTKNGVYKRNGSTWGNIINNGSPAERYWSIVDYDGVLYMANGVDAPQIYNGTTVTALSDAPDNSRHLTLHANRLFLVADDEPNVIRWSKYEDPTVFTTFETLDTDPGFQPINENIGEDIEGIVTFRNNVIIFKHHSMHALNGELGYDFTIDDISTRVGCIAHRTACVVNNRLFFLGHDGVYLYNGGSAPTKPISDDVRQYIYDLNWSQLDQCVAGTDGRMLFLTLVTGASTSPNVTLMYDPELGSWWVYNYIASAYLEDGEFWYTGTTTGSVYNMDDGDTDAGSAIAYEVVTKPVVVGDWNHKRRLNKCRVIADIPSGATLNVYYSSTTNGNDWRLIKNITATTDVKNTKINLVGDRSEWFRLKISGSGRVKIYGIAYAVG